MDYETILVVQQGLSITVTLIRPGRLNALKGTMIGELNACYRCSETGPISGWSF